MKVYIENRVKKGQINDRYESEFKTRTTIAAEVDSHYSDR